MLKLTALVGTLTLVQDLASAENLLNAKDDARDLAKGCALGYPTSCPAGWYLDERLCLCVYVGSLEKAASDDSVDEPCAIACPDGQVVDYERCECVGEAQQKKPGCIRKFACEDYEYWVEKWCMCVIKLQAYDDQVDVNKLP